MSIAALRTRVTVGVLLAVPAGLWLRTTARPAGPAELVLLRVAVLFALVGFTSLTLNMILVARVRSVERFFGGLDRLYLFHRRLAVVSVALLAVHAALVVSSLLVVTSFERMPWKVALGAVALGLLACGVLASFVGRMRHQTFVWVQRGLGGVFVLGSVHALFLRGALEVARPVRVYLFVLAAAGVVAFAYRSVFGRVAVPRARYRVERVNRLDDSVVEIVLEPQAGPMRFSPGQFAFLSMLGARVSREPHPYSIASSPGERRMRFMVKALGDYTTALQELGPGCDALVEGPYGAFWRRGSHNPRQVWIAGGVGIAPFLSMAPGIPASGMDVDLYYCTEGPECAHFIDELFAIADANPRFRVVPVRKRSLGRIDASDIEGASREIVGKDIFICGPPAMMRNLDEQFRGLGVAASQIHFEDFSFM